MHNLDLTVHILYRHRGLKDSCIPKSFMQKVPWRKGSGVLCLTTQSTSPHITAHKATEKAPSEIFQRGKSMSPGLKSISRCSCRKSGSANPLLTKLHVTKGNPTACSTQGAILTLPGLQWLQAEFHPVPRLLMSEQCLPAPNETRVCSMLPRAQNTLNK